MYSINNSFHILYNQGINISNNCLLIILSNQAVNNISISLSTVIDIDYNTKLPKEELKFYLGEESIFHISIRNGQRKDEII